MHFRLAFSSSYFLHVIGLCVLRYCGAESTTTIGLIKLRICTIGAASNVATIFKFIKVTLSLN